MLTGKFLKLNEKSIEYQRISNNIIQLSKKQQEHKTITDSIKLINFKTIHLLCLQQNGEKHKLA